MKITSAQVRAARALIDMSQTELAKAASVGISTIADFERGARLPMANNLLALQRALEGAGVIFTNGGEPGVKMRAKGDGDTIPEGDLNSANDV